MTSWKTILTKQAGPVATVTLNRPGIHNAMDLQMIRDLTDSLEFFGRKEEVRLIVITSSGSNFSSGADLNWMKDGSEQGSDQLYSESLELSDLFRLIWEIDKVVLTAISGKVMGGAIGLVAASDIVIAEDNTSMAFSEVKLGLVPATIAPYILHKAGFSRTSEMMLTGRSFDSMEAREAGLVHRICKEGSLREATKQVIQELLSNAPQAMKGIKQLLRKLETGMTADQVRVYTSQLISDYRTSPEGQEGMKAFFEKRNPGWIEEN